MARRDDLAAPGGVLWDLDGTLADSRDHHWQAWRSTMAAQGIEVTRAQFEASFGQRNDTILSNWLGPTADPDLMHRIAEDKEARFRDLVRDRGINPLPGAREWIHSLHAAGWRQAIASSAPRENIEVMHNALGLSGLIRVLVGAEDVARGKPDPEVFLVAADRLGIQPQRCVVVEDARAGIAAARSGGMASIGVGGAELRAADLVVERLTDLRPGTFESLLTPPL